MVISMFMVVHKPYYTLAKVNTLPPEHAHRALDCTLHEGHKALFRIGPPPSLRL